MAILRSEVRDRSCIGPHDSPITLEHVELHGQSSLQRKDSELGESMDVEHFKPKKVYVASKLDNWTVVKDAQKLLKMAGLEISYDWATDYGDNCHGANAYSNDEKLEQCTSEMMAICEDTDCLLLCLPGGRGSHFEFGLAYGLELPVVVYAPILDDLITFHKLKGVEIYRDFLEAILAVVRNCYASAKAA
jgi:hypothetical protein